MYNNKIKFFKHTTLNVVTVHFNNNKKPSYLKCSVSWEGAIEGWVGEPEYKYIKIMSLFILLVKRTAFQWPHLMNIQPIPLRRSVRLSAVHFILLSTTKLFIPWSRFKIEFSCIKSKLVDVSKVRVFTLSVV